MDAEPKLGPIVGIDVCVNHRGEERPSCMASGCKELLNVLKKECGEQLKVRPTTCLGVCHRGPAIRLLRENGPDRYIGECTADSVLQTLAQEGVFLPAKGSDGQ